MGFLNQMERCGNGIEIVEQTHTLIDNETRVCLPRLNLVDKYLTVFLNSYCSLVFVERFLIFIERNF